MPKKNKILSIFSFLLIFLFLFPSVANAFIGTGIFDYFTSSLEGVEEFSDFATKLFQQISLLLLITYIGLAVSASLLQWAISVPIGLYNNTLVWSGWNFTLGLANTFFILIFIIIALAYILKIETIGQKKILVNLILVALLVNFSLLLVGAVADIATFFQNTILGGETDLVGLVMKDLMGGVEGMLVTLGSWLVAFVVLYAIPFSGPFAQLSLTLRTLVTGAVLGVFGPTLMGWILIIILGLGVAGIFFTYFFFFVIRAYIIWALAVLAPLAFICLILPQTKKWWDEWLKHLLEWMFLGILLLLWLVLGLKLMGSLMPAGGTTITPIIGWAQIGDHAKYFLFLFVYLVIGLFIMQKTKPALAATVTALGGQIGGVMGGVAGAGARLLKREVGTGIAESPGIQKWAQRQASIEKRWGIVPSGLRRTVGRALGPSLLEARKADISKYESESEKVKTPELLKSKYLSAKTSAERIGIRSAVIDKGKPFQEAFKDLVSEGISDAKAANELGAVPQAGKIAQSLAGKTITKKDLKTGKFISVNAVDEMGFKPLKKEDRDKGYNTITDKLIGEAKGDEIKNFAKGFWGSDDVAQAIQRFWGGAKLSKAAQEFGYEFVQKYNGLVQKTQTDWYAKNNRSALLYTTGNAAQDLGFEPKKGLTRDQVRRELSKDTKPTIPPEPPVWEEEVAAKKERPRPKKPRTPGEGLVGSELPSEYYK